MAPIMARMPRRLAARRAASAVCTTPIDAASGLIVTLTQSGELVANLGFETTIDGLMESLHLHAIGEAGFALRQR